VGTPHQGPWATPAEIERWDEWRAERAVLDARTPREYVIDGRMIDSGGAFFYAIMCALEQPTDWTIWRGLPPRYQMFQWDAVADRLEANWRPRDDAVLVWKHHDQSRDMLGANYPHGGHEGKPYFDDLLDLLNQSNVLYRLE
jgi:hypothetical protein